jgi:NAD(P)H dehydrogenase (quinone)
MYFAPGPPIPSEATVSLAATIFSHMCLLSFCKVPETLHEEVLGKMGAPPKPDVPTITPQELTEADGILFGFPTRFGMMAAQMKAFFDATGGLWSEQSLAGKPAGIFFSTGTQGGGQETTP